MIRRIAGMTVGVALLIGIAVLVRGSVPAMLHLREFGHADADHPYAALSLLGMAIFAVGTFLGGLVSAYAGMRISRWLLTAGTIAILGCLVAYDSAEVFQNAISIWLTSSVAGFFGCWIGTRLAGDILV